MSDQTSTPTPTETLRERVRGALATVPLGEDDVHVFYVAEKHLDRLTDAALAAMSAAAPDERELVGHLDRFIADCAAEGVEKGVLSVEWAGRLRAALAARPAPAVSTADVEITTAAELDALPAGTIVRDRFGGYLAQGRDARGVAWFHYPDYDHAGSSAIVAGIGPVTVCFTPGLTVADEGRA